MKKYFILVLTTLCLGTQAQVQVTDTLLGRCDRFYYESWYDDCPSYQTPDYDFSLRNYRGCTWGQSSCPYFLAKEFYTPEPLTLYGMAAMVVIDPKTMNDFGHLIPDSVNDRVNEQLILFQAGANTNPLSTYYFPPALMLLDSVRWDTAAPKMLMLPKNIYSVAGDTSDYEKCLLYEVRFPTPITVDSFFYIGGTFRSNIQNETTFQYLHLPTIYQSMTEDPNVDQCHFCQPHRRLFHTNYENNRFLSDWIIVNDKYLMGYTAGPFIPVIAP